MSRLLAATLLFALASSTRADNPVTVSVVPFGKAADGTEVREFTLAGPKVTAKLITYGAILRVLTAPDSKGDAADVVLGFDTLDGYLKGHPYFGATVGRVANRVGGAQFTLDGKTYTLAANNGKASLHGGIKGFDKVVWKAESKQGESSASVVFKHTSPDGDEGYPGTLDVTVTYTLDAAGALRIDYAATTDKATPVNLTHHSYFNLAGHAAGPITSHTLKLDAEQYTPAGPDLVPTGKLAPVEGTPFDFRAETPIGKNIAATGGDPVGYDLNYVLTERAKEATRAAVVTDPAGGRTLTVLTTEPGLQFYTGNFLDGVAGKAGAKYARHGAFCLEAQHFPDSVNQPAFPSVILKPGETYRQTTVYVLGVK